MINYALKCAQGHRFESWFQSASAFDKLTHSGMVTCAVCGSTSVEKAVMAPRVSKGGVQAPKADVDRPLSTPSNPAEQAIAQLKEHIQKNSTYVGGDFADEARAIHDGTAPKRLIHGEANREDAIKLVKDGVPVAPLPFDPKRKTN